MVLLIKIKVTLIALIIYRTLTKQTWKHIITTKFGKLIAKSFAFPNNVNKCIQSALSTTS